MDTNELIDKIKSGELKKPSKAQLTEICKYYRQRLLAVNGMGDEEKQKMADGIHTEWRELPNGMGKQIMDFIIDWHIENPAKTAPWIEDNGS
jgi:hypothetical protein